METLFVGKNIFFLHEVDSTNSYATQLLKNVNLPEGTVIHAANQTKGKGLRGNNWYAESLSNLTCSVVLKPNFLELKHQFFLYQIAALACYDTTAEILKSSHFDIKIKWPNDILVNNKKICGILIENNVMDNQLNWCVIGMGMNVNQIVFNEKHKATSFYLQTQQQVEVRIVLETLCKHLEKYYLLLKAAKYDKIQQTYLSKFLGLNSYMDFEANGVVQHLLVKGISENGFLLLENENGNQLEADVKDFKWLY